MKALNKPLCSLAMLCAAALASRADTIYTINNTTADAFLATGSAANPVGTDLTSDNFGAAGTLAISPAGSTKGEFDSIIKFNTAAAVTSFNTTYGAGNWQVAGITLALASNFPTQGQQPNNGIFNTINAGNFDLTYLSYNSWVEGNGGGMGEAGYPANSEVSFDSISTLFSGIHVSLGTYTYTPPGNMNYLNYTLPLNGTLTTAIDAGGDVSLYAAASTNSTIGYLFNSKSYSSNHPELILDVEPIPEPHSSALLLLPLIGAVILRYSKARHAA